MRNVTRYVSPDGALAFLVIRDPDDITLGFEGYPWHTHGDILAELSGDVTEQAVHRFVEDLLGNALVIAVISVDGVIADVRPKDDPETPDRYQPENEQIQLRYWSGAPFRAGEATRRWNL
jgi:hypothetical protein